MSATQPTSKRVGRGMGALTVTFWAEGWPRWTNLSFARDNFTHQLDEEEVRDLHYALTRIIAYLDSPKEPE